MNMIVVKNNFLIIFFLIILLYSCKDKEAQKNVGEIYFLPEDYHTLVPLKCDEFYFLNKQVYKLQISEEKLIENLIIEFNNLNKSEKTNEDEIFDVRYRIVINDTLIFCIDDFGRAIINSKYDIELKMFNNIKGYIKNNENNASKIN